MKNISRILSIVMVMAILSTSCKKFDPWGGEPNGGTTGTTGTTGSTGGSTLECFLKGTLVSVPCGISDLANLWILAEDGRYYQPCDATILNTMDLSMPIKEGSQIMFGYELMKDGCEDETLILCPSGKGWPEKTKIRLKCISPIETDEPNECKPVEKVTDIPTQQERGYAEIMKAVRVGNCVKLHLRYSSAVPVDCSNVSLQWNGNLAKSNPAVALLYLSGLPSGLNSQVIQEGDVSFDISSVTGLWGANQIKVKIDGYEELF